MNKSIIVKMESLNFNDSCRNNGSIKCDIVLDHVQLPPEMWDLILNYFPIKKLVKMRAISCFFPELIDLNKRFRIKILLCKNEKDNSPLITQFQWAARTNNLEVLKWLYSEIKKIEGCSKIRKEIFSWRSRSRAIGRFIVERDDLYAFRSAAREGHLDTLQWLHSTFNITEWEVRYTNNCAFRQAAEGGHLEVLKWLHSTFNITGKDARDSDNYAFRQAAKGGHLKILKWLHSTFKLTREDARSKSNYAFKHTSRNCCLKYDLQSTQHDEFNCNRIKSCLVPESTKLEVLKWLCSTFNLTEKDARSGDDYAFKRAAESGYLEILDWTSLTFGLSKKTVVISRAFGLAAARGHLEVLKWLRFTFNLERGDITQNDWHFSTHYSCINGHLDVIRWIVETFNLVDIDRSDLGCYTISTTAHNGHLKIIKYLENALNLKLSHYHISLKIIDEIANIQLSS